MVIKLFIRKYWDDLKLTNGYNMMLFLQESIENEFKKEKTN